MNPLIKRQKETGHKQSLLSLEAVPIPLEKLPEKNRTELIRLLAEMLLHASEGAKERKAEISEY